MTRNRDSMTFADMIRLCTLSGAAILGAMLLLGSAMIAQKPEPRLILVSTPPVVTQVPLPQVESAPATITVAGAMPRG